MSDEAPTIGEVMRGLDRIEKRLDSMQKAFVSVEVHNLLAAEVRDLKAAAAADRANADAAIDKAKEEAAAQVAAVTTELNNAKKWRLQTWTALGLLFAGSVVAWATDIFGRGLGITP